MQGTESAAGYARLRLLAQVARHPSAILLLVQLASLLIYPFIERRAAGSAMIGAMGALVLLLAIRMVHRASGHSRLAIGIAVPAILLNLLGSFASATVLLPLASALEALFYFYAAGSLVAYMLEDRRATTDELFAAGATFTLLAWGFAYIFAVCQLLQPGSIGAAIDPQSPRTWTELLYMSFVLLSSTGIGDVIPLTPHARALASLEIFVGVMYLALVVSRLIGLTALSRAER